MSTPSWMSMPGAPSSPLARMLQGYAWHHPAPGRASLTPRIDQRASASASTADWRGRNCPKSARSTSTDEAMKSRLKAREGTLRVNGEGGPGADSVQARAAQGWSLRRGSAARRSDMRIGWKSFAATCSWLLPGWTGRVTPRRCTSISPAPSIDHPSRHRLADGDAPIPARAPRRSGRVASAAGADAPGQAARAHEPARRLVHQELHGPASLGLPSAPSSPTIASCRCHGRVTPTGRHVCCSPPGVVAATTMTNASWPTICGGCSCAVNARMADGRAATIPTVAAGTRPSRRTSNSIRSSSWPTTWLPPE